MRAAEPGAWSRGFTLIEVVVALLIFAISFGVLAQIFQTGFRQSARAEAMTAATLLARSELARLGVEAPLEIGESETETAGGFRVRTRVQPAGVEVDMGDAEITPFLVEVAVTWGPIGRELEVALVTLRLGAPRAEGDQ